MIKKASTISESVAKPRGWDALEMKLKDRGLSSTEIQNACKSFYDGIEVLSKMFLLCYGAEKKGADGNKTLV